MSDKFKYTVGLQNVGSHLAAGSPYVTSSTITQGTEEQINFPRVTNNITVKVDGQDFNSLRVSGSTFVSSSSDLYSGNGSGDYSISFWFKAEQTVAENRVVVALSDSPARSCIREKGNALQFLTMHTDNSTLAVQVASYFPGQSGVWNFLTFVGNQNGADVEASASMNATITQTGIAVGKTLSKYFNNNVRKFSIAGYPSDPDTIGNEVFIKDMIMWNGALSPADITTLYNGGNYYNFENFTTYDKLVWLKPDDPAGTSYDGLSTISNFGSAAGNFNIGDYGAGEVVEVNASAPFADAGSGDLRIHYRSTGSLPNVANNKHYWTLTTRDEEIKMNIKTKELYLSAVGGDASFSLQADLTNIPSGRMYQHTGSGVDE